VLGAKVRALCQGRFNVSVEDLKALAAPALRHRVILNFEGEADAVDTDTLIGDIVAGVEQHATQGKELFLR
jgi:MoxR-like ATPase